MAIHEITKVLDQPRRSLCPREKLLLVVMADGCRQDGMVTTDVAKLRHRSSLPGPSFGNTVQRLIRKGYLQQKYNPPRLCINFDRMEG